MAPNLLHAHHPLFMVLSIDKGFIAMKRAINRFSKLFLFIVLVTSIHGSAQASGERNVVGKFMLGNADTTSAQIRELVMMTPTGFQGGNL